MTVRPSLRPNWMSWGPRRPDRGRRDIGLDCYVRPTMEVVGVGSLRASAPGEVVMREYGTTVEDVCRRVRAVRDKKGVSER